MTVIAPMSSMTATPSRKITSDCGTRRPSIATTPSANAMSVAIGMPQPSASAPPPTTRTNSSAGTTMPPTAATRGRIAARRSANSPVTSSRLTSRPMTRKNRAMSPSLTTCAHRLEVRPVADREGQLGAPDVLVGVERDVRPDQRRDRRREQHDAARDLGVQEVGQRAHDEARYRPIGPRPGPPQAGLGGHDRDDIRRRWRAPRPVHACRVRRRAARAQTIGKSVRASGAD